MPLPSQESLPQESELIGQKICSAPSSPGSGGLKKPLKALADRSEQLSIALQHKQMSKNIWVEVWTLLFLNNCFYSRYLHFPMHIFERSGTNYSSCSLKFQRWGFFRLWVQWKKSHQKTNQQDCSDGCSSLCPQFWDGQHSGSHPLGMHWDHLHVFYPSLVLSRERGGRVRSCQTLLEMMSSSHPRGGCMILCIESL